MTQLIKSWNVILKGPFDLGVKGRHASEECAVYGKLHCVLYRVTDIQSHQWPLIRTGVMLTLCLAVS